MRNLPCTRRLLLRASVVAATAYTPAFAAPRSKPLAEIEARIGGRLGVYALDTGSGRELAHRADERFAMCSTFKWLLAAAVLARADRRSVALDEPIAYGRADLLEYAPVARENLPQGSMSVGALAQAAVTLSDNTAANLLLARIGGPAALTAFVRASGDDVTRLDRNEPELNRNTPGDPRDTTTPRSMVRLLRTLVLGTALQPESRARLTGWLRDCKTGAERLRAGLPHDWIVGDKTGTGRRGAVGDVAIATPPGRAPILIAAYCSDSRASVATLAAGHAAVGRVIAAW